MHTISHVLLDSEKKSLSLSAYTLHPTLLHSPILALIRQKQFLAPLASYPSFTVKPQGSIWFCLSHMWVLRAVGVVECVGRRHCRAMVSPLSFLALLSQLWPAPSQPA